MKCEEKLYELQRSNSGRRQLLKFIDEQEKIEKSIKDWKQKKLEFIEDLNDLGHQIEGQNDDLEGQSEQVLEKQEEETAEERDIR